MEDSKFSFSPNRHGDVRRPDSSLGLELGPAQAQGGRRPAKAFHLPLSPSSPGSLADLSASSLGLLSAGLVKSSSSELELPETDALRPTPLLSLVKSLSTEISRRSESDVCLSLSDSKLHTPAWKQLAQPRPPEAAPRAGAAGRDHAQTGPPSPGSLSPGEPRASSLMSELEDTRRKFSEAMQEPLSMLSKMMGEESAGGPRQARGSGPGDSPGSLAGSGGGGGGEDVGPPDTQGPKCRRRAEGERRGTPETPLRRPRTRPPFSPDTPPGRVRSRDGHLEICAYGDLIQVVETPGGSGGAGRALPQARGGVAGAAVPGGCLFLVGVLSYGFLVLPLPACVTGLSLGLACGFMLGLLVVLLLAPRREALAPRSTAGPRPPDRRSLPADPLSGARGDTEVLEGWMNEMHSYDPEAFHPSLTHSVFARLEGGRLRLAYPRANVPRRASFHEPPHDATFLRSRTFQLDNCKVSLLPPVLARKRLWNQKYPICIVLADGETGEEILTDRQDDDDDKADKPTFPDSPPDAPVTLYLFGRTGREKEEWFQHLLAASMPDFKSCPSREGSKSEALSGGGSLSGSTEDLTPPVCLRDLAGGLKERLLLDYSSYMSQLIGSESSSPTPSPAHSDPDSPTARTRVPSEEAAAGAGAGCEGHPAWVNALLGRVFWDVLGEKYWADQVAHKIQKKLSKIRLPYFMNELTLADLDMGSCIPQVLNTSTPSLDSRGLWLDLEVLYTGCLQMTLETKMNLCKLGKEIGAEASSVPETRPVGSKPRLCVLADSDEESSSAGSSDEEEVPPTEPQGILGDKGMPPGADGHGGSTGRKILRFVDKIAKSKYFQKATENEFIRKKMSEVSNMPLMLTVEVLELSGTLAVNIPPPPTDRIWYSFRVPPRLDLRVCPMLGEREVTFTHVTEWIERKLQCEFQKVLVMPNMDDLYLPLMTSGLDKPPPTQHSAAPSSRRSSGQSQDPASE